MIRSPRLAATAGIAALMLGCASDPAVTTAPLESPVFITVAGDTVRMEEELRIGRLDGPDEYTFAAIVWMLPTPDGGVVLYDLERSDGTGDDGRIRQFDAAGRFVRYIGQPGEGPGEYSSFPQGSLLPDGSLLIADQGLARFTRFDAAGDPIASWSGPPSIVELQPTGDAGWFAGIVTDHPEGKPRRIEYLRFDSLGREVDRFPAPEAYHQGPWCGAGAVDCPTSVVTILPDGRMVSARSDSLVLTATGPLGKVRVTAPHQPVAYQPEEVAARAAMYRAVMRRRGGELSRSEFPKFKPVFSAVWADGSGWIFVRLRTAAYKVETDAPLAPNQTPWREPFAAEVFDSTLAHRGRLLAPRSTTRSGVYLSSDAVWLVHEGESGELYLVKWRPQRTAW